MDGFVCIHPSLPNSGRFGYRIVTAKKDRIKVPKAERDWFHAWLKAHGFYSGTDTPHGVHPWAIFTRLVCVMHRDPTCDMARVARHAFREFADEDGWCTIPGHEGWKVDFDFCAQLVRGERVGPAPWEDRSARLFAPPLDQLPNLPGYVPPAPGAAGKAGPKPAGRRARKHRPGPFVGPEPRGGDSSDQEERQARNAWLYVLAHQAIDQGRWPPGTPCPPELLEQCVSETGVDAAEVLRRFAKHSPHHGAFSKRLGEVLWDLPPFIGEGQLPSRFLPSPGPPTLLSESGHSISVFAGLRFSVEEEIAICLGVYGRVHHPDPLQRAAPDRALRLALAEVLHLEPTLDWQIEAEHGVIAYGKSDRLIQFHKGNPRTTRTLAVALSDMLDAIAAALPKYGCSLASWLQEDCPRRRKKFPFGQPPAIAGWRRRKFQELISPAEGPSKLDPKRWYLFSELQALCIEQGVCTRVEGATPAVGPDEAPRAQLLKLLKQADEAGQLKTKPVPKRLRKPGGLMQLYKLSPPKKRGSKNSSPAPEAIARRETTAAASTLLIH